MKRILKVTLARTAMSMVAVLACLWLIGPSPVEAQTAEENAAAIQQLNVGIDTVWVMLCGMMVFFMNLGFGCVESGFARAKNTVNILSKNFVVFAVTSIFYWAIGWGLMFGDGTPYYGTDGLFAVNGGVDNSPSKVKLSDLIKADILTEKKIDLAAKGADETYKDLLEKITEADDDARKKITENETVTMNGEEEVKTPVTYPVNITANSVTFTKSYEASSFYWGPYSSINWATIPLWVKFFFQLVFAGTAATIVSGAVAERIKYMSFIVFSALMAVVMYPITGHWIWGGGWLSALGFWDFAGCAVVHSVGGWAAMTGAYILGPRIGKYGPDGKINAIPGHNMTSAFIGCLVLWLGWFGFNPGSTMGVGDGKLLALIAVNTNAAAAMATITATATAWIVLKKPDLGMTINGCLAGLVAITAPCAWVSMTASLIIGAVAGVFVVFSVLFFDRIKCDDPVGATSVHLGCGTLGCLAVGLFSDGTGPAKGLFTGGDATQLIAQIKGIVAVGVYTVVVSAICWFIIKYTIGLRVSAEEEIEGLDIGEHGHTAYHGFVMGSAEGH